MSSPPSPLPGLAGAPPPIPQQQPEAPQQQDVSNSVGALPATPDPAQDISRHIMAALSGGSGHPMDWARATLSGVLGGAANVGRAPEGAGFLYGLSRGAAGQQAIVRQNRLDQQARQQQQFENQLKTNQDTRAQQELGIHQAESNAQIAMWNANEAKAIHEDQRAQALFQYQTAENQETIRKLMVARQQEAIDLTAQIKKAVPGISNEELENDVTSFEQMSDGQKQGVFNATTLAIHNGEEAKPGEDNYGHSLLTNFGQHMNTPMPTDGEALAGYNFDKNGNPVPQYQPYSKGTPLSTILGLAAAAEKSRVERLSQINDQAKLAHEQASTNQANNEAYKAKEEGDLAKSQILTGPGGGPANPVNIDPRTGANEQYLSGLNPTVASEVRAIGEGRVEVNSRMFQSKQGQQLAAALTEAYPGFDQSKAQSYFKTRQDFTSGKTAQAINSYNTGIAHLGTMWDHLANASTVDINNPWSTVHRQLDLDKQLVSTELAKAVSNGSMTEGEKNQILGSISGATVNSYRDRIREAVTLLHGKQEAFQQQWNNAAPPGAVSQVPIISQQAEQTISRISGQQQPQQAQGHPHPVGEVREYMGAKYIFDGQKYVLQQGGGEEK